MSRDNEVALALVGIYVGVAIVSLVLNWLRPLAIEGEENETSSSDD